MINSERLSFGRPVQGLSRHPGQRPFGALPEPPSGPLDGPPEGWKVSSFYDPKFLFSDQCAMDAKLGTASPSLFRRWFLPFATVSRQQGPSRHPRQGPFGPHSGPPSRPLGGLPEWRKISSFYDLKLSFSDQCAMDAKPGTASPFLFRRWFLPFATVSHQRLSFRRPIQGPSGRPRLRRNGEAVPGFATIANWSENGNFGL